MRKIIRYIFWIFIILFLIFKLFNPIELYIKFTTDSLYKYSGVKKARSSISYILSSSKELTFNIPSFTQDLKFIFTANIEDSKDII